MNINCFYYIYFTAYQSSGIRLSKIELNTFSRSLENTNNPSIAFTKLSMLDFTVLNNLLNL